MFLDSRAGGFGPSFSAWRWALPPSGLGLALPSLGKGLAIFGAAVAPSFSSLGLALPVGLALPSLRVGVDPSGRGWPDPKGKRPGPVKKGRIERPGAQPKGKEVEGH